MTHADGHDQNCPISTDDETCTCPPAFADAGETTIGELAEGDFVVVIPTQSNVRGMRVNSGLKTITDDAHTGWGSGPYRRRKTPVNSRRMSFLSGPFAGTTYDVPSHFTVIARKRV